MVEPKVINIYKYADVDGERVIFAVKIGPNTYADVMLIRKTGLYYVMSEENGDTAYKLSNGKRVPVELKIDESTIINAAKCAPIPA